MHSGVHVVWIDLLVFGLRLDNYSAAMLQPKLFYKHYIDGSSYCTDLSCLKILPVPKSHFLQAASVELNK